MLAAIEGMITELRQIGVPVSIAERVDAVQTLRHLPLADRGTVKAALRAVLVKTRDHELAFDAVFDLYFTPEAAQAPHASQAPGNSQAGPPSPDGAAGLDGQNGHGAGNGGGLGSLDDAALTELLLAALRDGNDVMLRAIASLFVDRHAGIEPGRPVAGTYYLFRTMRAVDPDRLMTRLTEEADQGDPAGLRRRLQLEDYEAQMTRFRAAVEAEVRRRLVGDRGAEAVARTLRRPLPEDVDFLTSSRDQIAAMRTVLEPLARRLGARLAEKRRLTIAFAPATIAAIRVMYFALAWNRGNTDSNTSSSV